MKVRSLFEQGRWSDAVRLAEETSGHSADLDLYHGLALARLDRLDLAELALEEGRQRYPSDVRFDLELAGIAYRKHNLAATKRWLQTALWSDPANQYGNEFLASVFLLQHNLTAALKYWDRIGKPVLQDVRFIPAPQLDPLLCERTFAFSGGQVLTPDRLRTTAANLERLGLLDRYQFDLIPRDDERFDVNVRSIGGSPSLGGVWGEVLPLLGGLPYETIYGDFYDLGQQAINFHVIGRWDPDKRRIMADVAGPVRSNPRLTYRFAMDARDESWDLRSTYFGPPNGIDGLILRKAEGGGELEYGLTNRLNWTSGLWLAYRDFQNAGSNPIFANGWSVELRNGASYRLLSIPEHRFRVRASTLLRTARVLTTTPSRFVIAQAGLDAVWFPQEKGDDRVVEARANAGTTRGALPFDDYFMLGMERDNDLWFRGLLGAQNGQKGTAPLGTRYSLLQISLDQTVLRFPLGRIQIGPFFDSGTIGDGSGQFGSRGWMFDAGLEAKIRLFGNLSWVLIYGRDLRSGRGAFYTADQRSCRTAGLCL